MPMPAHKSRWQRHQCDMLERLAEAGCPFKVIAARVGHPVFSCYDKIRELRIQRGRGKQPKPAKVRKPAVPKQMPRAPIFLQAPAGSAPLRATSTSKLILDAELRSRISEQGLTAGLLGDPRPGRSALDRRKENA